MRNGQWKRLLLAAFSGAILFQAPGCVETALGISTLASVVTAGGVIYLIRRVLD
jgi:hypothetical protein